MNYVDGLNPDTAIYRITGAKYLLQDIMDGRLTMTRIDRSKWGDPTENPLLVAPFKTLEGNDVTLKSLTENFFGSCWSFRPLGKEEDWEAFGHAEEAVRIESTPGRLLSGFESTAVDPFRSLKLWIGRVTYDRIENINAFFDEPDWEKHLDPSNTNLVKTVLRLRSDWKNEQEVRLIFDRLGDDWDRLHAKLCPSQDNAPRVALPFKWSKVVTSTYPGPTLTKARLADLMAALHGAE